MCPLQIARPRLTCIVVLASMLFPILLLSAAGFTVLTTEFVVRLMKAAPQAPAFAASLNIAGANVGIGVGAIIGGRVIDSIGLGSLGFTAAGIIMLSILLALWMMLFKPAPVQPSACY